MTDTKWEAFSADFSPDGKYFSYVLNADGRADLYLVDHATLRAKNLEFPEGLTYPTVRPASFSPDGKYLLVGHQSSRRPADLWVYDLERRHARQLTFSAIASLNPEIIPESQLVHYQSFDGKMITALLWMPFNIKPDSRKAPLLGLAGRRRHSQKPTRWWTSSSGKVGL